MTKGEPFGRGYAADH